MYLTEIAEALVAAINTSSPGNWGGGIVLPADMPVMLSFDPFTSNTQLDAMVYVVPGYNEYTLETSRRTNVVDLTTGATGRTGVRKLRQMAIGICKSFEAKLDINNSRNDVTVEREMVLLTNLREDLENFLIHTPIPGLKLETIESLPLDELALDQRIYLAITTLGYKAC